jgi:hypothetical protein
MLYSPMPITMTGAQRVVSLAIYVSMAVVALLAVMLQG